MVINSRYVTDTLAAADLTYTIRVYQWVPARQSSLHVARHAAASGDRDPRGALDACLADLADNKPADAVLARLRALEPALAR